MASPVVLLTDFGLADPYVGQLKATLLREAPTAPVVDLSHDVSPFNIVQGAFFLAASWNHFAEGTVFLSVVDPGVGTERRCVAAEAGGRWFVGPDNGLSTLVLRAAQAQRAFELSCSLGGGAKTFHGRDIFAPAAARIARGDNPAEVGTAIRPQSLLRAEWAAPKAFKGGVVAYVLHIDRFGNCVLNLDCEEWLPKVRAWGSPALLHPRFTPLSLCEVYGRLAKGEAGILPGSQGYLELAVNRGSARTALSLNIGDMVRLGSAPSQDAGRGGSRG